MGWFFPHHCLTKADIIRHCTTEALGPDWKCHAKCIRGTTLYAVLETPKAQKFIAVFMLAKNDGVWGYKDVEESMGPCVYDCPLKYFEMVPVPDGEYAQKWREEVKAEAARKWQKLAVGQKVKLRRCSIPEVTIVSLKPLRGRYLGSVYRVSRKFLAKPEQESSHVVLQHQPAGDPQG